MKSLSARTHTSPPTAQMSQNLECALAFSATLRRATPRPECEQITIQVQQLVHQQRRRRDNTTSLGFLQRALAAPTTGTLPAGPLPLVIPERITGLILVEGADPIALAPPGAAAKTPAAQTRSLTLQVLARCQFSKACAKALLRFDPKHERQALLVDIASQALIWRAEHRLLGRQMSAAQYTALANLIDAMWADGAQPDATVDPIAFDFDGSLLTLAMTLCDDTVVRLLLEPMWPRVQHAFDAFERGIDAQGSFSAGPPFADVWLDAVLASPAQHTRPDDVAKLTHTLVARMAAMVAPMTKAMQRHLLSHVLIKVGAEHHRIAFDATLGALDVAGSPQRMSALTEIMQFCVHAAWPMGVALLLKHGFVADTRLTDVWLVSPDVPIGQTAMALAAGCPDQTMHAAMDEVIALLLQHGADPRIAACRPEQKPGPVLLLTPLHFALEAGNWAAAARLIKAEHKAPAAFAQADRQTLAHMHRVFKRTFYTKRGVAITPDTICLKRFALTYLQTTMHNFHLQNASGEHVTPGFEAIGRVGVLVAEHLDERCTEQATRAQRKERQARLALVVDEAQALAALWPENELVPLPPEFCPNHDLAGMSAADFLTVKALNQGVNNLFIRLIAVGDASIAARFLELYPQMAMQHICQGFAFAMRKSLHKDTSQAMREVYLDLVDKMLHQMTSADGVRIMLELCCVLGHPQWASRIIEHAQRHNRAWQTSQKKGLCNNMLHVAIAAPNAMLAVVMTHLHADVVRAWLRQQNEQGDTPLHLMARDAAVDADLLLGALQDFSACGIENMAGRDVATEALMHGQTSLFHKIAAHQTAPIPGEVIARAVINQPRMRRRSFLYALQQHLPQSEIPNARREAMLTHVIQRHDVHALRLLCDLYHGPITTPSPNTSTVLHMAAQSQSHSMVQTLKSVMPQAVLHKLARSRDEAGHYPEDYTAKPKLHGFLRSLRKHAATQVQLEADSPLGQGLVPLADAVSQAADEPARKVAVRAFVRKAAAWTDAAARQADQACKSDDMQAVHTLAWQVLDTLAAAEGPGCGAHFAAHRPDVSLNQLRRRVNAFGALGASRFGPDDALTLLRLRQTALADYAAIQNAEDDNIRPARTILEYHDNKLRGEGFTRCRRSSHPVAYSPSPYVRFVLGHNRSGAHIISWYPIAELTAL